MTFEVRPDEKEVHPLATGGCGPVDIQSVQNASSDVPLSPGPFGRPVKPGC